VGGSLKKLPSAGPGECLVGLHVKRGSSLARDWVTPVARNLAAHLSPGLTDFNNNLPIREGSVRGKLTANARWNYIS
jgi:hypothetical protein